MKETLGPAKVGKPLTSRVLKDKKREKFLQPEVGSYRERASREEATFDKGNQLGPRNPERKEPRRTNAPIYSPDLLLMPPIGWSQLETRRPGGLPWWHSG